MSDDRETLRRELLEHPGQALPQERVAQAVALLEGAEPKLQRAIGAALIRAGAGAAPYVAEAFASADASVRRAAVYVLGELLRATPDPATLAIVRQAASDPDPKVRKNAAIALGNARDPGAVPHLIRQLHAEPFDYVRPSIILALGAIGGSQAHEALARYQAQTGDDQRALQLALDRSSAAALAPVRLDLPIDGMVDLVCKSGLESILARELAEAGIRYEACAPGRIRLAWQRGLADLFAFRCFESLALPVMPIPERPLEQPRAVAEAFARSAALPIALQITGRAPGDSIRYRVTLEQPPQIRFKRVHWLNEFTAAFSSAAPDFANSPGRYSWEFPVTYAGKTWYLGIRPTAYTDPRFAYRVADVPAALHPSVAAALARLADPVGAIVLDPFCGSGTLLIECAQRAAQRLLIGVDNDARALEAARQNAAAAGIQAGVKLVNGDARNLRQALSRFSLDQVDAIVTNPPYGVRVGSPASIARLYPAFFEQAALVLAPDGRLVMLFKDQAIALEAAKRHGFVAAQRFRVNLGGILVWLVAFRRG